MDTLIRTLVYNVHGYILGFAFRKTGIIADVMQVRWLVGGSFQNSFSYFFREEFFIFFFYLLIDNLYLSLNRISNSANS